MAERAQIPGEDGGCPEKVLVVDSSLDPAPQAEQSPLYPSADGRGIRQMGRIFALRCGLLGGVAGGDPLAGLLSATQAERRCRRQPIGQNRESLPARLTDSAAHPNAVLLVIVSWTEPSSMADDRVVPANRTSPRQEIQWDHPGSMLSFVSGSAIKRITAGVKALR
jgi:hypothetical protein